MKKVKKLIIFALMFVLLGAAQPVFADSTPPAKVEVVTANSQEQAHNLQSGGRNVSTGWVEMMDGTHQEAAKGKSPAGHMTGLVAGSAVGARNTLHRVGAGAIDLLTFWIPKKQPLINPEKARLE